MTSETDARVTLFQRLPVVQNWPEMGEVFARAAARNPHGWDLPVLGCKAVKGSQEAAIAAEVALGSLQISIILIDDMLDEEPEGMFREWGHAQVSNMAAAFQAAGLAVVAGLDIPEERIFRAVSLLNEMVLETAYGQKLDIENAASEEAYWQVVRYKSTPYYRAGIMLGAVLAGATLQQEAEIRAFGTLYGELIQLHDDLKDTMQSEPNPDWLQGRFPLPILFAHLVPHPDRERFESLRTHIEAPGALQEAQEILVRSGAVSYCLEEIIRRYRQGEALLDEGSLPDSQPFRDLLEDLIDPVREVFTSLEIGPVELAAILADEG